MFFLPGWFSGGETLFQRGAPFRMRIISCMAGGIVLDSFARHGGLKLLNSIGFPRLTPGATTWRPLRGLRGDPA